MRTRTSAVLAVCLVVAALVAGGCFSAHSTRTYTGQIVSKGAEKKIQIGKTTKDRLITVLGNPTEAKPLGEGVELLKYEGTEEVANASQTAFVGGARETVRRRVTHYYEVEGGVVARHWKDSVCLQKDSKINAP
ncbi:MAG TPA: hypothetical protein VFJ30_00590 [Phycisphaerae bacterium]|nr:hypothetical protein [Phycisphaerae bacterium]